ncbi:hypothetical protein HJG45_08870 [Roseicella sp. DB1501]|nr:hypothetical protein [Roseicella sp. DB1501]
MTEIEDFFAPNVVKVHANSVIFLAAVHTWHILSGKDVLVNPLPPFFGVFALLLFPPL